MRKSICIGGQDFTIPATVGGAALRFTPHSRAILQAFLVTFLWSTSWILIKLVLDEIPPLTFAGLRYTLAFLILLPGLWKYRFKVRTLSVQTLRNLIILGMVFYALTQGGVFFSLKYLESITFSLMLNFTTLLVAIGGMITLREFPSLWQWGGITAFLTGVMIYFYPFSLPKGGALGLLVGMLTMCTNAAASILGRSVNRDQNIPPFIVTTISMGIGAVFLIGIGLTFQGLPSLSYKACGIIAWLAIINTAIAFTLWNKTLQTLTAVESSMINNTMLIQIAVLAWIFLEEKITLWEGVGLVLVFLGTLVVQTTRPQK